MTPRSATVIGQVCTALALAGRVVVRLDGLPLVLTEHRGCLCALLVIVPAQRMSARQHALVARLGVLGLSAVRVRSADDARLWLRNGGCR